MTSWRPQSELEEDFISLQPECNFIYGNLTDQQKKIQNGQFQSRPKAHLDYLNERTQEEENDDGHLRGLNAIRAVHRMTYPKPLGMPTNYEELNNSDNLDRETAAMIRKCGMGPTVDMRLNEAITIPTLPITKDIRFVRKGSMKLPVILNDDYFQFESTRMRNARLSTNFKYMVDQINGVPPEPKTPNIKNISVLNEDEVKEPSETEIVAEKYEKYLEAYPKIGQDKVKMSSKKATKPEKSFSREEDETQQNNKLERRLSTSLNSTSSDPSLYESFTSDSSFNSSTYFSAIEWPALNSQSFSKIVSTNTNSINENPIKKDSYTPKELYNKKRHP